MDPVRSAIRQPVTVVVGVVLVLLAGVLALQRIPIQLTPNVEDTIIAVTTRWEGASPQEVEQDLVDPQEERLQGITGLKRITSTLQQGTGSIRLEFDVGTPKEVALREVSDKLREVPSYPENVDEPVVEASDPENRDFIAWFVFDCTDPAIDVRQLQDFAEDRIKPALERVSGVSEINVLGGRERETQVRFDPVQLAEVGVPIDALAAALRRTNDNVSAGALDESRTEVRLRMVSQYENVQQVLNTLVAETDAGTVYVRDVAEVVETFKEPTGFVRSRGRPVIAINAQREVGANVMEVMNGLQEGVDRLNAPGGVLDSYARQRGLEGIFTLEQVYDQTIYIDDALALVRSNIWIGGGLAILVLYLFLRSLRSSGIIALSIPISVIGAVVFLVSLGRSVNVISLAGMAFAVGMVVDNAIVVLENVFRHLEMGKTPMQAAYDGTREVFGAVIAATLTTVVVFLPILLIEEEAGQLFRDIALAIVAAVSLSLLVSVTVIPTAAARLLRPVESKAGPGGILKRLSAPLRGIPDAIAGLIGWLSRSVLARIGIVVALTAASLAGTWLLMPPLDYLPVGNRNLVFGLIIPPPGMSVEQQETLGLRIEEGMRPYFEAGHYERGTREYEEAAAAVPPVPTFDFATMSPGAPIVPPPLENYFLVAFPGSMFHGGIGAEPERVADLQPLFRHVTRSDVLPGVMAFAFQVPLFRLGGRSGSAVAINFSGDDLGQVTAAAQTIFLQMMQEYGPFSLQPDPSNFDLPTPELQIIPNLERLGEVGLTPTELGIAVQALGDGAFLGDYVVGSQTIDLKLVARDSLADAPLALLGEQPLATPRGDVVPLSAVAELRRVNAPGQVNRTGRQRSVSLQFTPPPGMPLGAAIASVQSTLERGRAAGVIPFDVETSFSGSASKLDAVKAAMLGDGTLAGMLGSSLILALLVVYLLMCVLFQSFLQPLIIMFSVPLATLGGFAGLYGVHVWSQSDPYMPAQNLDVLTMLGFVILIGIVVNNAILIVHQALQFLRGEGDIGDAKGRHADEPMTPQRAITEAVRTRVRPIFMGTMTSVLGMSPLIFMPGAGSELYRGLGSVVVGGLLVSTVFTLLLVPLLLSLAFDVQARLGLLPGSKESEDAMVRGGATTARFGTTLALLVLGLLVLPGCGAPAPRRTPVRELAADVLRAELAQLEVGQRLPVPADEGSKLEEAFGPRLAELEELGGPSSWNVDVDLGRDLDGAVQRRASLTVAEAVQRSLGSNLALEVTRLQTDVDREGITVAEAAFDTEGFGTVEGETASIPNRVPVINGITIGTPNSAQDRALLRLGLRRRLAGGATVSLSAFFERLKNRTDGIDFVPDPAWQSGLAFEVAQPLLRGFGSLVNQAEIELARRRSEKADDDLAFAALLLRELTEDAYQDLVESWAVLRVFQRLRDQGDAVERVLRARLDFDANQAAYADALATLRRRESDVLRARRVVRAASDRLKSVMNDPELPLADEILLEPAHMPSTDAAPEALDIDVRAALARAFEARPDVHSALLAIEDAELRERLAADAKRPQVDLFASVSVAGLDETVSDSLDSLAKDDEWTALLGFELAQPFGARAGRAAERQARLQTRQVLLAYEETLRTVVAEVKVALRDVATRTELVVATRATRLAETENLRTILVEEAARSVLTPEFLALKLGRQERLATAQVAELAARAEHARALAAWRRAIGAELPSAP